jgi:hypothetical protein
MADLLEVARQTGLRGHLHGVNATEARAILQRFVDALPAAPVVAYGFDAELVADMLSNYQRRVAAESGESARTKIIQQQADALRALAQQPGTEVGR